jgi:hypothetical protein
MEQNLGSLAPIAMIVLTGFIIAVVCPNSVLGAIGGFAGGGALLFGLFILVGSSGNAGQKRGG